MQVARAEGSVGGHLDVTTDYVFRGVSQTRGKPAAQADLHYQTSAGWFAGAWGSTVDLNRGPGATMELNAYAGRAWPIGGPWNARITAVQYYYPNDTTFLRYDYFELVASLAYEDRLALTMSWSPNTSRYSSYGISRDQRTFTYEMVGQWPLREPLSATGSVGYYDLSQLFGSGYFYGSVGLGGSFNRFRVDVAYFATNQEGTDLFGPEVAGDRWSLTVAWWF
jgi:uncharacterized protein (TIGR02001 family)